MNLEMESMYSNSIWELVDPPKEVRPIRCKWIYKRKKKKSEDGKVETFKVRLVVKGYTQKEGVDYEETFLLVAMLKSICILLSSATCLDHKIWQMDVKIAFSNRHLEECIYIYIYGATRRVCSKRPRAKILQVAKVHLWA